VRTKEGDKMEDIAVRVNAQGRAIIPKNELEKHGVEPGDVVLVTIKKARIEEAKGGKEK